MFKKPDLFEYYEDDEYYEDYGDDEDEVKAIYKRWRSYAGQFEMTGLIMIISYCILTICLFLGSEIPPSYLYLFGNEIPLFYVYYLGISELLLGTVWLVVALNKVGAYDEEELRIINRNIWSFVIEKPHDGLKARPMSHQKVVRNGFIFIYTFMIITSFLILTVTYLAINA